MVDSTWTGSVSRATPIIWCASFPAKNVFANMWRLYSIHASLKEATPLVWIRAKGNRCVNLWFYLPFLRSVKKNLVNQILCAELLPTFSKKKKFDNSCLCTFSHSCADLFFFLSNLFIVIVALHSLSVSGDFASTKVHVLVSELLCSSLLLLLPHWTRAWCDCKICRFRPCLSWRLRLSLWCYYRPSKR